ncbi:hypothetical protein [Oceanicella actignis]|nr:hypothetical protein [Oceanicella actignis]
MSATIVRILPTAREAALDIDAIEALREAVGPHLCREIIEDGILHATDRLAALERALREDDWAAVARIARDLIAVPGQIGMTEVSRQARALLDVCVAHDPVALHAVAARLLRTGRDALMAAPFDADRLDDEGGRGV